MTNPIIRIHNTKTNEIIDREMTKEEYALWSEEQQTEQAEAQAKAEAKAALLERLGITEEEAKLLLG